MEEDNAFDSVIPASLEAALVLNYAYQELLNGILNCVDVGIGHARYQREELVRTVEEACKKQPCKKRTLYNLVYPYFRDESDMPAPKNEDCKLRELQQFLPKEYPRAWKDSEKADLRKAVHDDALRNLMAPLMNRLDLEYSKLEKVETRLPLSRNTDYDDLVAQKIALKASIANIQEEISEIQKNFVVDMVTDESMVDWLRISMSQFEGYHTSESCAAAWRNVAHPAVRDGKWTASEDKRLKELVGQYKQRQWAQVAVELGTGRSPFMCLQRYRSVLCKTRSQYWTSEEDERLIEAVQSERTRGGSIPWMLVAAKVGKRSASKCINRWNDRKLHYAGGPWRTEEDVLLAEAANMYGLAEGLQWLSTLPASRKPHAALWIRISGHVMTRTPIQCKHRWNHSLDPRLKFGQWTRQEDTFIARWLNEHGRNGWTDLAALLPGRTANMVIQRARRLQRCRPDLLQLQREIPRAEDEGDATSQALPEDLFSSNTKIVRSAVYQRRPEVIAGLMMVQMSNRMARDTPHMDRQQLKSVLLNNLQRQMGYVPAQLNAVMKTKVLDAAFQPTSGNGDLKSRAAACMSELGVALSSKGSILSSHAGRRRRPVRRRVSVDDRGNQGDPCDDRSEANKRGSDADVDCSDRRAAAKAQPRSAAAARVRAAAARSRAAAAADDDDNDDDDDDDDDSQESQSSAVAVDTAASRSTMTRSRAAATAAAAAAIAAAAAASRARPSPARTAGTVTAAAAVQSGPRAEAAAPAEDALQLSDADEPRRTHRSGSPRTSAAGTADGSRRLTTASAAAVDTEADKMLAVAMQAAISAAKSRSDCSVTRPATAVTCTAAVAANEGTSVARKRSGCSVLPTNVMAKKGRLELETEEAQVDARIAEQIFAISKAGAATSVQSLTMEHDGSVSATAAQVCLQMMGMSRETALARLRDLNACPEKLKQFPPAQAHRMLASAQCIEQLLAQASIDITGQAHRPSPQPVSFAMRPAKTVREQLALRRSGIDPRLATLAAAQGPCTVIILPTPESGIELLQPPVTPVTIGAAMQGAGALPSSRSAHLPAIVLSSPAANGTAADDSSTARAAVSVARVPEPGVNVNAKNHTAGLSSPACGQGDGVALASPLQALPIVPLQALPIMPPQSSTVAGYRTLLSRLPQLEACCDSAGRRKLEEMEKNIAVARQSSAYETLQARLESLFLWPAILSGVTSTDPPQISATASTTSGEARHDRAEP